MGLFSPRKPTEPQTPEAIAFRQAIQSRGPMDLQSARQWVDQYLTSIATDCGCSVTNQFTAWVEQRMRMQFALRVDQWFETVCHRAPVQGPALQAEFAKLLNDPTRHPIEELVAWWWQLDPSTFIEAIPAFFGAIRHHFVDRCREIVSSENGDFVAAMYRA